MFEQVLTFANDGSPVRLLGQIHERHRAAAAAAAQTVQLRLDGMNMLT